MENDTRMKFGKLEINPALNPAILDTGTWHREAAWAAVHDAADWMALRSAAISGAPLPTSNSLQLYGSSVVWSGDTLALLSGLPDGQQVFLAIGPQAEQLEIGEPIGSETLAGEGETAPMLLALYPTDAPVVDRFVRKLAPERGPRALGAVPRLGIGTRMTTAVWPAIWEAMARRGFAANAIQNSVRELNFLETLLAAHPAERNIAFGFGAIETGYTGSSYEGLWVAGVLNALQHGVSSPYGADADHIQVKRGAGGLERAKRLLEATRYYSFYTLDVSDVLDYAAMASPSAVLLEAAVADPVSRNEMLAYHRRPRRIGGFDYRPDEAELGRLAGKYWVALDAVVAMHETIRSLKHGVPFDLELSIDEHPNEVPTFECLTSETELIFVLLEAQRRNIPLSHVAPNFGVEKGTDYRGEDGPAGLEVRARILCQIAEEFGVMADFHSGDDLSAASRQAIGRATAGRNHFKVSPNLQLLFAEVLLEYHPYLFLRWWEDALAYARREAAAGSSFAHACLRQSDRYKPSPQDAVFHNFSFAFVGRRNADGQFICRETFYSLSPAFYRAYQERLVDYLFELADDLFCYSDGM